MSVSVVVVNYNGGDEILECLRSVSASTVPVDIVVVDNASSDGSPDRLADAFPQARLIRNDVNTGFATAANQGVRATTSAVAVLVNADATAAPDAVERLAAAMDEHPRAGAVGPLVRNPDGSVQPSRRTFPTLRQSLLHGLVGPVWPRNPATRAYTLADISLEAPSRVGWVSASAVAVRRAAFDAVGGFDEGYFFFVSDVDLCRRMSDAGWETWFEPRAEFVHAWGGSWTRRPLRFLWEHQASLFRYVRKHRRGVWVLAWPLILLGLFLRFVVLALRWIVVRRSVPPHSRTEVRS